MNGIEIGNVARNDVATSVSIFYLVYKCLLIQVKQINNFNNKWLPVGKISSLSAEYSTKNLKVKSALGSYVYFLSRIVNLFSQTPPVLFWFVTATAFNYILKFLYKNCYC